MAPEPKRRKLRSAVWEYFDRSEDRKNGICKLCPGREECSTLHGCTTGLKRHLQTVHSINVDLCNRSSKVNVVPFSKEEKIASLAAADNFSFSRIANSTTLRELFVDKGVRDYPRCPNSVRDIVMQYSNLQKTKLKKTLKGLIQSGVMFATTIDEWTSAGRKRFMSVNLHYKNGQAWNLGLARITGSLTSANATEVLRAKLTEFDIDLDKHIVGMVTDGASTMKKMGRDFSGSHQICLAHGIHLAVCDVIFKTKTQILPAVVVVDEDEENEEDHDSSMQEEQEVMELEPSLEEVVKKVRKVVKIFLNSPKKLEVLHRYTKESHKIELGVILDVKTRWNSTLYMLQRFYETRVDIQKSLIDLKEDQLITSADIKKISEIIAGLMPLEIGTKKICCKSANLITGDVVIQFMLSKLHSLKSDIGIKLFEALKTRMEERRSILFDVIQFLNPANRQAKQKSTEKIIKARPETDIVNKIKELYEFSTRRMDQPSQLSQPSEPILLEDNAADELIDSPLLMVMENELADALREAMEAPQITFKSKESSILAIKSEISSFQSEGIHGKILETVYNLLLAIPPSTVEAERVFSCANSFCTKIRSRLGDDTIDALVFLKYYFKDLE